MPHVKNLSPKVSRVRSNRSDTVQYERLRVFDHENAEATLYFNLVDGRKLFYGDMRLRDSGPGLLLSKKDAIALRDSLSEIIEKMAK